MSFQNNSAAKKLLLSELLEADKQTIRGIVASPCAECRDLVKPAVQEVITRYCPDRKISYCAPCFMEIELGIIPRNKRSQRY